MLKILQARLQQYVNWDIQNVQAGFRKGRGTRDQIANICCIIEKAREFQKNIYFCFIDYSKTFNCVDHNKLWNTLKEMGIPDHLTISWETCMQGKKQQSESDMEQQTGSKLGKEYVKAVYCHPVYLTYMQSTSCEMAGWMKHKLESRLPGEISIISTYLIKLMAESEEELKSFLMKVKEESEKTGLKCSIQKAKIMAFGPITSLQIDGETVETVADFILGGSKITADDDCSHEIKRLAP